MAGVPAYITPLSYIRGSGSQYITTEINLRSTDVVKSKWRFEGSAGNVYGCFTSSGADDNFCLYAGSASTNAYIRYNGQLVRDFKAAKGTIYNLEHGPDGFFANGDQVTSFNAATFECSAPMYIFMLPNSSSAKVTARCYGLTVFRGGDQLCNFIPARNELTGKVGFYESVGGVFYENDGTGAFTAGPEVNYSVKTLLLKRRRALSSLSIPAYTSRVEYLQSTGTQYIDTGIYGTSNLNFEVCFEFASKSSPGDANSATIFGARQSYLSRGFQLSTFSSGTIQWSGTLHRNIGVTAVNTKYVVKLLSSSVYVNGVPKVTVSSYTFDTPTTLLIFALQEPTEIKELLSGRIYYLKLYDRTSGDLIADFIPVRVEQTGYLYDTVTGKLLRNAGTGAFILGPDI